MASFFYRLIGKLLIIIGCALYISILSLAPSEWRQNPDIHISIFHEFEYIFGVIFGSGLPPLIVAMSYFINSESIKRILVGCFMTLVFIIFHNVSLVWMAHGSPVIYMPLVLLESALSIWVAFRRKKWDVTAKPMFAIGLAVTNDETNDKVHK